MKKIEICETIKTLKYSCGCVAEIRTTDRQTHTSVNGSYFQTCPTHSPKPDEYGMINSYNPNVYDHFQYSQHENFASYIEAEFGIKEVPINIIEDLYYDVDGISHIISR